MTPFRLPPTPRSKSTPTPTFRSPSASRTLLAALALAGGLLAYTPASQAQSVSTAPVGAITTTLLANSDVFTGVTLRRADVFQGIISSYSGNTLTVSNSPNWAANSFVYQQGVQPETYYCEVLSGNMRGAFFTITANGSSTLTVDSFGASLNQLAANDRIAIRPYWTLGTLFTPTSGFPSSSTFTPTAEVQLPNTVAAGTNLVFSDQFFYYSGTLFGGAGWRKVGASALTKFDNTILYPDVPFRIRNRGAQVNLTITGLVPLSGHRISLGTINPSTIQDNFVFLGSASSDHTLASLNLISTGAFAPSPTFTPTDTLLVYDNFSPGFNKSPAAIYFYYSGTLFGGAGWRRVGANALTIFDNDPAALKISTNPSAPAVENRPIGGLLIRKAATTQPTESFWNFLPTYTSQL